MHGLMYALRRAWQEEHGTEVLEWALVCGLIVVGAIAAIVLVGPKVATLWTNINAAIP